MAEGAGEGGSGVAGGGKGGGDPELHTRDSATSAPADSQGAAAGGGGRKARGRQEGTKPSEKPRRQWRECEKDKDRLNG